MEGINFDTKNQIRFQIELIKNKKYVPNDLTDKEKSYLNLNNQMSFEQAKQIFENQNYEDPPMRGRQSFAILKKMGLCTGSNNTPIKITNFGNDILDTTNDIGDLFFTYFIKWQLPNPIDTQFKEEEGFAIKPFLGTLHLINEVNQLWEKENTPVGISKEEFSLFVPTLIHYDEIKNQAKKIIEFRKQTNENKEKFKIQVPQNFLKNTNSKMINKLL